MDLGLSSPSTDVSFEQESSAETEVEKDINEVHSEDRLQKEGVSEDADVLIFADTLLNNLGRKKEKGKVRIKWNGGCTALKDFVTLVLKYKGMWKCRTDKGKDIYTFNKKDGNCTITWWSSNGTVNIQGSDSKPTTEKIEKIITKMEKNKNYTTIFNEATKPVKKRKQKTSTPTKKGQLKPVNQNLQEQINNIWSAVNELKSLITSSMKTPLTTEESIIEVNEATSTERNSETSQKKLITDYFKPKCYANIGKKEKQTVKILNKKITELETEVANLKEENNQLKTELHHIKQGNKSKKDQTNLKPGKSKILEKTSNEKSNNINPAQDNAKAGNVAREREERPLIIVAGDSIVEGLKGWLMPRRANVKVFSFSCSTITDMEHFIKPLINKQPRQIILHIGTNDLLRSSPLEVTAAIKKLTEIIMSHGIQCVVSEITYRDDDLWRKAKEVNRMMRNHLQGDVKIIDNTNISEKHLNSSSLHLNQRGSGALALNYITYIRSIDLS